MRARKLEKMIGRLGAKHWELLEEIEESSLEYGVGDGVFDEDGVASGPNAGEPLLVGDDEGRGLVKALVRCTLVAIVEEDGLQSGHAITRAGWEALEKKRTGAPPIAANLPRADRQPLPKG